MCKYEIFQVKRELTREFGYMSKDMLENEINLDNYDSVYQGEIEGNYSNIDTLLEDLFVMFNISHPDNFTGRSMSVSDVVQINDNYFYCDSFGWEKIAV
ncbi:hypothetical protein BAOM_3002 [Peribacillus asahii]|uniref:YodL-like domain-containing protein n=1 Tax=Peribacillus asahii TaxID=228899 RepID=A0A3T0KTU0_9BACI|nr:YodL domain-containing protein [Peribacillus asahii]AZV43611.1 hypothetical protein BAOM_3002 [Peribacillus asahii]